MFDYEKYEEAGRGKASYKRGKIHKMPKDVEDRTKGRKLNHRTKKSKAREF